MPVKPLKAKQSTQARIIKPAYWLAVCAIPLIANAAKEKTEVQPELSLELLEFLADYSDDKGQLVDPETLDPIVKTAAKKPLEHCISTLVENDENGVQIKQDSEKLSQPETPINVKENEQSKQCHLNAPETRPKQDMKGQSPQIEETISNV